MAEYTLHCFAQSGNAYKVALMLALNGADWEPRWVDFFNGETRGDFYRAFNVMGEVPLLVHHRSDGDRTLGQSGAILHYLSDRFGTCGAASDDERYEILRWMFFDNHKLTSYTATYRFLKEFAGKADAPETAVFKARAQAATAVLEFRLRGRDWVAAERPTIADISLCGYLFWPEEIGVDWADYPAIGAWLARIQALPGWVAPYDLMPGHPLPGAAQG